MYNEADLVGVKGQIKKILVIILGIFALFLAAAIAASKLNNKLGMAVIVVGVCIDIFFWGMYATPVLAYYRYLKDIITGRSRSIKGVVLKVGTEPLYKDNKLFYYEVLIEEDGIERIILLDDQKKWPALHVGKTYEFEIHENYVINIIESAA